MGIHLDTLEYATTLEKAGLQRPHAEAIAKLQARAIEDLVEHDLVTKDFLRAELTILKAELREDMGSLRNELRDEFRVQHDELRLQLRSLQYGGAIAAFALGAIVLLARLIN